MCPKEVEFFLCVYLFLFSLRGAHLSWEDGRSGGQIIQPVDPSPLRGW